MGKLQGKVAVITGGTTGIGLAAAKLFVAEGAQLIVMGRRQAELDEAVAAIGPGAKGVCGDVTSLADLDRLHDAAKRHHGRIDIICANAGMAEVAAIEDISEAHFDKVFGINTKGAMFTVQKLLPLMNDGGSIVMTGSPASSKGMPYFTVASGSKAAVRSFVRTWTTELKDRRIRANIVSPGPIETPALADQPPGVLERVAAGVPMGRLGQPEEVARAMLFLASDDSSFTSGMEIFVDGGRTQV